MAGGRQVYTRSKFDSRGLKDERREEQGWSQLVSTMTRKNGVSHGNDHGKPVKLSGATKTELPGMVLEFKLQDHNIM